MKLLTDRGGGSLSTFLEILDASQSLPPPGVALIFAYISFVKLRKKGGGGGPGAAVRVGSSTRRVANAHASIAAGAFLGEGSVSDGREGAAK